MSRVFIMLAAALLGAPAFADGRAVIESPTPEGMHELEVSWDGEGRVRFDPGNADAYMLVRDGVLYAVTSAGGMGPQVINLSSIEGMAGAGASAGPDIGAEIMARRAEAVVSMEPTGRTETLADMEGELYEVTWRDAAGETHVDNAVLTDAPLALELDQAFAALLENTTEGEPDARQVEVRERGLAILRYADSYTVLSAADAGSPPGDFELPAEPMDLQSMMQGMGPNR